jgi:ABC-type transporter Mla subunit MlaD
MGTNSVYLRVGLLIVGGIALLLALIWFLAGGQVRHGTLFESYFRESVQGLEVGATVKYRGVTLGRVTEIGLVSAEYGEGQPIDIASRTYQLVYVRYVMDTKKLGDVPGTAAAVSLGLRARIASQGLTGLSYIELDFVDPKQYPAETVPWTPKGDYIPSMPSTFSQVQDAAQQFLAKMNKVDVDKVAQELLGLLTDLRGELVTGDVHTTLAKATDTLQTLDDSLRAANIPALTADLQKTSESTRGLINGEQVRKLLDNANIAAQRLAEAGAKLPPLIASMQATAQRANNSTADVEQSLVSVLRDIQAVVQNLRAVTDSLRQYPAQILTSQPPPRSGSPSR